MFISEAKYSEFNTTKPSQPIFSFYPLCYTMLCYGRNNCSFSWLLLPQYPPSTQRAKVTVRGLPSKQADTSAVVQGEGREGEVHTTKVMCRNIINLKVLKLITWASDHLTAFLPSHPQQPPELVHHVTFISHINPSHPSIFWKVLRRI